MLSFDANLTTMYSKLPLLDAMATAKADGFDAIECRTPFGEPAEKVRDVLDALSLNMVQFNSPMGDFANGERGLACLPGREHDFRSSIEPTIAYAKILGVPQVNCVAGLMAPGASAAEIEDVLIANLQYAAPRLADAGIKLQIEPINPIDNPGAFLSTTERFARVHERVGHDNLYLQYDFYHLQVTQGDLIRTFGKFQHLINHVQVADNPGRHEPGTGEINYDFVFSELLRLDYRGWIGCEYVPSVGLGWRDRWVAPL